MKFDKLDTLEFACKIASLGITLVASYIGGKQAERTITKNAERAMKRNHV